MKHRQRKIPEKKRRDHDEDLRSENRRLRKEVQQLRRQLQKWEFREEEIQDIVEGYEADIQEQENELVAKRCPECKSPRVHVIEKIRGTTDYYSCDNCGAKGRYK